MESSTIHILIVLFSIMAAFVPQIEADASTIMKGTEADKAAGTVLMLHCGFGCVFHSLLLFLYL